MPAACWAEIGMREALAAAMQHGQWIPDGWRTDLENMPRDGRFEVLQRYDEAFRHEPDRLQVIHPKTGRMFKPVAWRPLPAAPTAPIRK
jgi:hypothetical protein